mmetsp:Transcript_40357/g.95077  ORF Transcript_40357/g.95077 Transcript_40357/m.95077 type:complete len:419 (+) Transcript_40357:247-1503(+)
MLAAAKPAAEPAAQAAAEPAAKPAAVPAAVSAAKSTTVAASPTGSAINSPRRGRQHRRQGGASGRGRQHCRRGRVAAGRSAIRAARRGAACPYHGQPRIGRGQFQAGRGGGRLTRGAAKCHAQCGQWRRRARLDSANKLERATRRAGRWRRDCGRLPLTVALRPTRARHRLASHDDNGVLPDALPAPRPGRRFAAKRDVDGGRRGGGLLAAARRRRTQPRQRWWQLGCRRGVCLLGRAGGGDAEHHGRRDSLRSGRHSPLPYFPPDRLRRLSHLARARRGAAHKRCECRGCRRRARPRTARVAGLGVGRRVEYNVDCRIPHRLLPAPAVLETSLHELHPTPPAQGVRSRQCENQALSALSASAAPLHHDAAYFDQGPLPHKLDARRDPARPQRVPENMHTHFDRQLQAARGRAALPLG